MRTFARAKVVPPAKPIRLAAAYPHSTENWRISACASECNNTYRSPGNLSDGSKPLRPPAPMRAEELRFELATAGQPLRHFGF